MIRITIYKDKSNNNEIVGFKSEGHAGYDRSGKDIICAATSILIINTVNSIEQFTDVEFESSSDEKNAIIKFMINKNKNNKESLVLLKAMELGLTEIARDNSKYISITFEEV